MVGLRLGDRESGVGGQEDRVFGCGVVGEEGEEGGEEREDGGEGWVG